MKNATVSRGGRFLGSVYSTFAVAVKRKEIQDRSGRHISVQWSFGRILETKGKLENT